MGRARHPGVRAGALRHGAGTGARARRHGDGAAPRADREPMTIGSPFAVEIGLGALLLLVFLGTLFARGDDRRALGWRADIGVLVVLLGSLLVPPAGATAPALGGMFVLDGLAIFAKRLFLVATFIGLLAGLSSSEQLFAPRSGAYHLLLLTSLLGMCVLASARDLILLFLAFELMSIPLYVLSGLDRKSVV